jgi:starch synthase
MWWVRCRPYGIDMRSAIGQGWRPDNWREVASPISSEAKARGAAKGIDIVAVDAAVSTTGLQPISDHAHDWQASAWRLSPICFALRPDILAARLAGSTCRPRAVMTVHNIAFQGQFPASLFGTLGLPAAPGRSTAWNITAASASSRRAATA